MKRTIIFSFLLLPIIAQGANINWCPTYPLNPKIQGKTIDLVQAMDNNHCLRITAKINDLQAWMELIIKHGPIAGIANGQWVVTAKINHDQLDAICDLPFVISVEFGDKISPKHTYFDTFCLAPSMREREEAREPISKEEAAERQAAWQRTKERLNSEK